MAQGSGFRSRRPLPSPTAGAIRTPGIPSGASGASAASQTYNSLAGQFDYLGRQLVKRDLEQNLTAEQDAGEAAGIQAARSGQALATRDTGFFGGREDQAFNAAAEVGYAQGLEVQIEAKRHELEALHEADPEGAMKAWDAYQSDVSKRVPSSLQQRVALALDQHANRMDFKLAGQKKDRADAMAAFNVRDNADRLVTNALNAAREGGNPMAAAESLSELHASVEEAVQAGLLPPASAAAILADARDGALAEGYLGAFAREPSAANLQAFLETDTPELTPQQKDHLAARMGQELTRQENAFREAAGRAASDVEIAILHAQDLETLDEADARTEELYAAGAIPPGKRVAMHRASTASRRAITQDIEEISGAFDRYNNGLGLNSQAESDKYYDRVIAPQIAGGAAEIDTPEAQAEHALNQEAIYARRAGHASPRVRELLSRAEGVGDPGQLLLAATSVSLMRENAPAAASRLTVGPHVESVLAYQQAFGVPIDQAVQMTLDRVPREPEVVERRRAEFKDHALPGRDLVQGSVAGSNPWFGADAIVPPEVEIAAERAYETAFVETGSAEAAQALASNTIRQRYQVSRVGRGAPIVTERPPELFVPGVFDEGTKTAIIDEDVRKDLAAEGIEIPALPEWADSGTPEFKLQAEGADASGQPVWRLWLRDEFANFYETGGLWRVPDGEGLNELAPAVESRLEGRIEAMNVEIRAELARLANASQGPDAPPRDRTKLEALIRERDALQGAP